MLTGAATDPVWYGCVLSSHDESWAKYNMAEPIPLQVENVAVEFVEPFRPSGPCLRTKKISAPYAVLTPAISPITGRLVEGGSVFLPTALITCQACAAYLALVGFDSEWSIS